MDIQYVILGLLDGQPLSGYDLKKIISQSDLFYWSGNNNQIYNSLVQLHKTGLVSQTVQPQENLPARKIYTITDAGRAELQRMARAEPELPEFHSHFQIQLAWTGMLPGEELDRLLERYEQEIAVQVRMRQAQGGEPAAPGRTVREAFVWQKIHDHLLGRYQHELDWVRQVRRELREAGFTGENQISAGESK